MSTTPPFRLSPSNLNRLTEVEAMCRRYGANPAASIDLELEHISRDFYYRHRPIIGVFHSLDGVGFDAAWTANREANMAQAYDEWRRVAGVVWRAAA